MSKKFTEKGWEMGDSISTKNVLDDIELLQRVTKNVAELYKNNRMLRDFMESASVNIEMALKDRDKAKAEADNFRETKKTALSERDQAIAMLSSVQEQLDKAERRVVELENENSELNTLYMEKKISEVAAGMEASR